MSSAIVKIGSVSGVITAGAFSYSTASLSYDYTNGTGTTRTIGVEWPATSSPSNVTLNVSGSGTNSVTLNAARSTSGVLT